MTEVLSETELFSTEADLLSVLHEARFAAGIAASGQRAGFGGQLFTRDACRVMLDTMDRLPSMTRELLSLLPQMQGIQENEATNEFLNAMPHQTVREFAGGRRLPDQQIEDAKHWANTWGVKLHHNKRDGDWFTTYNSSDAAPLYLITLAQFHRLPEGKDVLNDRFLHYPTGKERTVGEAGRRCVDFIMSFIEQSEEKGHGLYMVPNTNPKQTSPSGVMRDGIDSYYYPDGTVGRPVDFGFMAYIDNQALVYEALLAAVKLYPDNDQVAEWKAKAEEIRQRTLQAFWMEEANYFAAAVDAQGKQVKLESTAAAELLNGPFLKFGDGPDYVRAIAKWLYSDDVLTPIGPRMLSQKFDSFEADGKYYAYQGSGAVWPHVNGIIARGLRRHGLYVPAYDLGVRRTLGLLARTGEAVEVAFVDRKTNQPVLNLWPQQIEATGAVAIAAAERGQLDQSWAASGGLRQIWDWHQARPQERKGAWQLALARQIEEIIRQNPSVADRQPAKAFYVDTEKGEELKKKRERAMKAAA